ncbi:type IV pilin protein [Vibrio sagamiensis]|uniref:Prepilin-type N-terminal cleavage/methylation domain-containing protein n=1 Tax=Vibrio sagamiensis NBRC 104589 TaxID=1219064 RepID=A0A511QEB6_9VIBR|nr:type IV pilin protein [Vibrio sagamiensis]GEM75643.1 prepilin-type N-terminal cleavage/methylation domain-containing protein [Vibrio sagamiensis NBRC 104589]
MIIRINECNTYKKAQHGMTFIELLIVMAVITVISTIAYSNYQESILRSHRIVALSDLARIQLALESTYQNGYDWNDLVSAEGCLICESDSDRFAFTIVSSASIAYTIKAIAKPTLNQDNDPCFVQENKELVLTSTNNRTPISCWK